MRSAEPLSATSTQAERQGVQFLSSEGRMIILWLLVALEGLALLLLLIPPRKK